MLRGSPANYTWDKCHVPDATAPLIGKLFAYKLANFFNCANYSPNENKGKQKYKDKAVKKTKQVNVKK